MPIPLQNVIIITTSIWTMFHPNFNINLSFTNRHQRSSALLGLDPMSYSTQHPTVLLLNLPKFPAILCQNMQLYIRIHFQNIETSLLMNFDKVFSSNPPSWTHANSIAKRHHHHNFYANNVSHKLEHELIWTNLCASWYNPSQTTPPPINPSPLPSQSTKRTAQVCPVQDPLKIWSQISFPSKIPRIWDEMNRFSLSSEITTRYKWNWTFSLLCDTRKSQFHCHFVPNLILESPE